MILKRFYEQKLENWCNYYFETNDGVFLSNCIDSLSILEVASLPDNITKIEPSFVVDSVRNLFENQFDFYSKKITRISSGFGDDKTFELENGNMVIVNLDYDPFSVKSIPVINFYNKELISQLDIDIDEDDEDVEIHTLDGNTLILS